MAKGGAMRRTAIIALAAGFALLGVACGGDSETDGGAEVPTGATGGTSEGTSIALSIGEDGPDSMFMNLNSATAPTGVVTFVITNEGKKEHEFVVLSTPTAADALNYDDAADEVVEDDYTVVDEIEEIPAGSTENLTVDLTAGHYALICNLEGHYRMGMQADFDVT
jgi:uncharacterized cupredoxin-like copper-binding protein